MLSNEEMSELVQPIINIYNHMEYDLIVEIAKRFDNYDTIGGTLEWQLGKLQELGVLNADMIKIISKYSKKSQAEIVEILKKSRYANIDFSTLEKAFDVGAIAVNPSVLKDDGIFSKLLEETYTELNGTFRLIQTKALESAKQAYMDIINRSYIEVATGVYDYNTAIKRAIQRMAANGITGATYLRGGKLVKYSIESTVRRDTLTAAHKMANRASDIICDEIDAEYVEVSAHLGARVHVTNPIANHAGWQGKVFKINGSDKYPNLKESTGYPDDILGLGGVNCRHRIFPFFPGISTPNPINFNESENKKAYILSQQQRKLERDMRKLKKAQAAAKAIGDTENLKKLNKQILEKSNEIDTFCNENGLKRDHSRELVSEQYTKVKSVDNDGKSGIMNIENQRGIEKTLGNIKEKNLSAGRRKTPFIVLEESEITFVKTEISAIGADVDDFVFNSDKVRGTCFLSSENKVYIKGNIFPDEYSEHPRDKMSVRAVLAHEYYGHKPYVKQYLKEDNDFSESSIEKVKARVWADEFRASYMAAKNAPNLSDEDRVLLIMDALSRAEEAGVEIKYNNFIRRILYG